MALLSSLALAEENADEIVRQGGIKSLLSMFDKLGNNTKVKLLIIKFIKTNFNIYNLKSE